MKLWIRIIFKLSFFFLFLVDLNFYYVIIFIIKSKDVKPLESQEFSYMGYNLYWINQNSLRNYREISENYVKNINYEGLLQYLSTLDIDQVKDCILKWRIDNKIRRLTDYQAKRFYNYFKQTFK